MEKKERKRSRRPHSLYTSIVVPVMVIISLQIIWICGLLWSSDTLTTLTQNALSIMEKNTENAGSNLSTQMLDRWSNVGSLSADVENLISTYLTAHNMTIEEFMADEANITAIEGELSAIMLSALRFSNSTGIYVIFSDNNEAAFDTGETLTLAGLHFRDFDPENTPSDYSDIKMERGNPAIGEAFGLETDVLWQEKFTFTAENTSSVNNHQMYLRPLLAAREDPSRAPTELAYWGRPRVLATPDGIDLRDNNSFITYSLPLIFGGNVIGVIGTEIQVAIFEEAYLNYADFENLGEGGYILGFYEDETGDGSKITVTPRITTGETVTENFPLNEPFPVDRERFTKSHMISDSIYVYNHDGDQPGEPVHMSVYPLNLYAEDSPFYDNHWFVAGVARDTVLFSTPDNMWRSVVVSGVVCLLVGLVVTGFIVAFSVRPLRLLTRELQDTDGNGMREYPPLKPDNNDVREVAILRDVLNNQRERRIADSARIAEERERYRLALSLAAGTVMEYDPAADTASVSSLDTDNTAAPRVTVVERILIRTRHGEITHPEDTDKMIELFCGHTETPVVIRVRQNVLDPSKSANEYYFNRFICKVIRDADGNYIRLLGTTRDVTADEIKKQLDVISLRTDPTTRLYNAEYGKVLCETAIEANEKSGVHSLAALIQLEPALATESYYGLFYTNILHAFIAKRMRNLIDDDVILIRAGDNAIMLFKVSDERDESILQNFCNLAHEIYVGENPDIILTISVGAAISEPGMSLFELTGRAAAALRHVLSDNIGGYAYFRNIPVEHKKVTAFSPIPVTFALDVMSMSMTSLAFNLFERAHDTPSVINMLERIAAYRYKLSRVFIVENDLAFLSNNVSYSYTYDPGDVITQTINRVPEHYYAEVDALVKETGLGTITSLDTPSEGIKTLLRLENLTEYSVLVCGMYESGELMGKIVFVRPEASFVWDETVKSDISALTKVIASHLSRSKSDTASKAKTEFLSKISHEIRTPMNAILGLTDIAAKSYAENDVNRTRDCLAKIDGSAKFLLSIINDVLDMSKIESGTVVIDNKPFNAAAAVNDIAQMIRPLIEQKHIEFITEIDMKDSRVLGDEARLKQVITNLLGNALKFTDSGTIKFTCKEEASFDKPDKHLYTFTVSDTGIGISKEDTDRIFSSYVQLTSSDKVYGGTGLGLSISAKIVRLMGGNIEVESEVGHGSNFRFTIPLVPDNTPEELPVEERDYTGFFAGKRVLLVEDNELNTEIAVTVLEEAGFEVVAAANGKIGAEEYDTRPDGYFDVILMDIRMPILDGLGATRLIRTNTRHPDARTVPIIAMTANAFDEDMRKSLEAGMSGYLPKPIDTVKMYKMLETIFTGDHDGEFIR